MDSPQHGPSGALRLDREDPLLGKHWVPSCSVCECVLAAGLPPVCQWRTCPPSPMRSLFTAGLGPLGEGEAELLAKVSERPSAVMSLLTKCVADSYS